jgi:large subunit ribosomal protein L15
LPFKRGFTNINKVYYKPINVGSLARFESGTSVDSTLLFEHGLINKESVPVVILGDGTLNVALTVKAHRFSASAREKIEQAGGTVEIIGEN